MDSYRIGLAFFATLAIIALPCAFFALLYVINVYYGLMASGFIGLGLFAFVFIFPVMYAFVGKTRGG